MLRTWYRGRSAPAKARRRRLRVEWAGRQSGRQRGVVVARRRDVVGRVGVEERRQVLDLAAAGAELELVAAVGADAALGAVVVAGEQLRQAAEARRLDVDHLRRER